MQVYLKRYFWAVNVVVVAACAVLGDGRLVVSASWDKTLRVWDSASGQTLHVLHGHSEPVYALVASSTLRALIEPPRTHSRAPPCSESSSRTGACWSSPSSPSARTRS